MYIHIRRNIYHIETPKLQCHMLETVIRCVADWMNLDATMKSMLLQCVLWKLDLNALISTQNQK